MNKKQVKVFNQLLEDENFKGKEQLEHLLWLNTSKPKYKVGDCVVIKNCSRNIFGYQVTELKGEVTDIFSYDQSNEWHYRVNAVVFCGSKPMKVIEYALESEIDNADNYMNCLL